LRRDAIENSHDLTTGSVVHAGGSEDYHLIIVG